MGKSRNDHKDVRAARAYARGQFKRLSLRDELLRAGTALRDHLREEVTPNGERAVRVLPGWDEGLDEIDAIIARDLYEEPSTAWVAAFAARWAACGFPEVTLSSVRHAALLMASSVTPDLATEVRLPWPAFSVAIPAPLLTMGSDHVTRALVRLAPDDRVLVIAAEHGGQRWTSSHRTLSELARDEWPELTEYASDESAALGATDKRMLSLVEKLVVGVCLELDEKSGTAPTGQTLRQRESPEPEVWTYQLVRDVNVDVRRWVKDYLARGGKSPSVQSLVRGHWKNQPCGPALADRKRIHVEPHWRGPADGPIAVRRHQLRGRR